MGIVGVRLLVAGAEVEQLFEIAQVAGLGLLIDMGRAADRFGQAEKLHAEALDVHGVGHHPLDRQLQHVGEVGFPAFDIRLGAGHGHRVAIDRHREDLVALGKGIGHQRRNGRDVDFQRIDAQVRLAGLLRQPQGQAFQIQVFTRTTEIVQLLAGDEFQRVHLGIGGLTAAGVERVLGRVLADKPLGDQLAQQIVEIQPAVLNGKLNGHAGSSKTSVRKG
ncbi:hypothetical protein D3C73_1153640 [compost metagenome]